MNVIKVTIIDNIIEFECDNDIQPFIVPFTKSSYKKFKILYETSTVNGNNMLIFENNEVLTEFARYIIAIIDSYLNNNIKNFTFNNN